MNEPDEPADIQRLIRELAATGVDPWWVYEAVVEQDRLRAVAAETDHDEGSSPAKSHRTS